MAKLLELHLDVYLVVLGEVIDALLDELDRVALDKLLQRQELLVRQLGHLLEGREVVGHKGGAHRGGGSCAATLIKLSILFMPGATGGRDGT